VRVRDRETGKTRTGRGVGVEGAETLFSLFLCKKILDFEKNFRGAEVER